MLLNNKIKKKINCQLWKLKNYPLSKETDNVEQIAKYIAKIHSYDILQNDLPLYDVRWVRNLVLESKDYEIKSNIITALEIMSKIEIVKKNDNKFLTWNIGNTTWQADYETGYIGSYVWDIAAIINYVSDSTFSDIFLESYIKYGRRKPTLTAIYANIYYVQTLKAVMDRDFGKIESLTEDIITENSFYTDIISVETISRLRILGY